MKKACEDLLFDINSKNCGAEFYRADLHIHLYGSSPCVTDDKMTLDNLISKAKNENIKILSITNHNNIDNLQYLYNKGKENGMLLVPGVELSTPQGHLLTYFEKYEDLNKFMCSLSIIVETNKETRCNTGMFECLEKLKNYDKAFAILAHIDKPKGLLENSDNINQNYILDILKHPKIVAFEVKEQTSEVYFCDKDADSRRKNIAKQRIENLNIGKRQFLARVMFSDAHSLESFGKNALGNKRITRIKMDDLTFSSLKHAFMENDSRIRIEDEIPESIPFIYGIKYIGGILNNQEIKFSKNLNCIIGGRGTGKSTIFDTVRCLDKNRFDSTRIDTEIWPEDINYIWQDELNNKTYLSRLKYHDINNLSSSEKFCGFCLETFGQGDTSKIVSDIDKDPSNLIKFLDSFIDFENLINEELAKIEELKDNKNALLSQCKLVQPLIAVPQQLKEIETKLKTISDLQLKEIIKLEQDLTQEDLFKKDIINHLKNILSIELQENIDESFSALNQLFTQDLLLEKTEVKEISEQVVLIEKEIRKFFSELHLNMQKYKEPLNTIFGKWTERENKLKQLISQKKETAIKAGITDLSSISKLISQQTSLKNQLIQLNGYNECIKKLRENRQIIIEELDNIRKQISQKRKSYAQITSKLLKDNLNDLSVSLKYREQNYSPKTVELIKKTMSWRTSQVCKASILVEELGLSSLIKVIKEKDVNTIHNITNNETRTFTTDEALEIVNKLGDEKIIFELEEQQVSDTPKIIVSKIIPGATKPLVKSFLNMSLGQQQSILLSFILLSNSCYPLIVDQPEDNLDGEFIYQSFIPILRRAKERRQIIIVTHNPNIAVLGDAELILPLRATVDKTIIKERGSIDRIETNKMTCDILEGASDAFRKRALIYGFQLPQND